jgi:hypothetical protein
MLRKVKAEWLPTIVGAVANMVGIVWRNLRRGEDT